MRNTFVFLACLSLMLLSSTAVQAKAKFVPINQTSDGVLVFSGYNESWSRPIDNLKPQLDTAIQIEERQRGRRLRREERTEFIKEQLEIMADEIHGLKLSATLAREQVIVYKLGLEIPDQVDLLFNGPGVLVFTVRGGDGSEIQVPDIGIICIKKHRPSDDWEDTRNGPVRMNNKFNRGASPDLPNVVLVRLPSSYFGMEVLRVTTTDKLVVEDHRVKVDFK